MVPVGIDERRADASLKVGAMAGEADLFVDRLAARWLSGKGKTRSE